jgi:hypothetical protein
MAESVPSRRVTTSVRRTESAIASSTFRESARISPPYRTRGSEHVIPLLPEPDADITVRLDPLILACTPEKTIWLICPTGSGRSNSVTTPLN